VETVLLLEVSKAWRDGYPRSKMINRKLRNFRSTWRRWLEAWDELSLELEDVIEVAKELSRSTGSEAVERRAASPLDSEVGASLTSITATSPE
jgi:hypothetical protein